MTVPAPRVKQERRRISEQLVVMSTPDGSVLLSAALFAAARGARVVVVERTDLIGGTSAYTAGTLWIPGTHLVDEEGGPSDERASAERYLDQAVGDRSDPGLRRAFLDAGPEAVRALADEPGMELRVRRAHPDYMAELPDAAAGWRPIEAQTVARRSRAGARPDPAADTGVHRLRRAAAGDR